MCLFLTSLRRKQPPLCGDWENSEPFSLVALPSLCPVIYIYVVKGELSRRGGEGGATTSSPCQTCRLATSTHMATCTILSVCCPDNFMLQRSRTDYDHIVNCLPYWVLRWTAGDGGALGWCFLHASLTTSGNNLQPQMEGRTYEEFKDTVLTQIFWGGKTHLQSGPRLSLEVYVRTWKKVGSLFVCFLLPWYQVHSSPSIRVCFFKIPA